MNKFEKHLMRLNFRKISVIYLLLATIVGIVSSFLLCTVFGNEIKLMVSYKKVSKMLEHNADATAIKSDLANFAYKNADVVDVVILDEHNKVLFSAKDSEVAKSGTLNLEGDSQWERENKFMFDSTNPKVIYRLIKKENSLQSLISIINGHEYLEELDSEYFFGASTAKRVYSLNYVRGRNESKTCFIFDFSPVQNGVIYVKVITSATVLLFMLYWVLLSLYVYANALKSKLNGAAWGILVLFTNLGGLIIYKIYKQSGKTCFKCNALQGKSNLYCTECGVKIGISCKKCGRMLNICEKYCGFCGEERKEY